MWWRELILDLFLLQFNFVSSSFSSFSTSANSLSASNHSSHLEVSHLMPYFIDRDMEVMYLVWPWPLNSNVETWVNFIIKVGQFCTNDCDDSPRAWYEIVCCPFATSSPRLGQHSIAMLEVSIMQVLKAWQCARCGQRRQNSFGQVLRCAQGTK